MCLQSASNVVAISSLVVKLLKKCRVRQRVGHTVFVYCQYCVCVYTHTHTLTALPNADALQYCTRKFCCTRFCLLMTHKDRMQEIMCNNQIPTDRKCVFLDLNLVGVLSTENMENTEVYISHYLLSSVLPFLFSCSWTYLFCMLSRCQSEGHCACSKKFLVLLYFAQHRPAKPFIHEAIHKLRVFYLIENTFCCVISFAGDVDDWELCLVIQFVFYIYIYIYIYIHTHTHTHTHKHTRALLCN